MLTAEAGLDQAQRRVIAEIARNSGFAAEAPTIDHLPGDGSERRFFRLRHGSRHAVLLISPRREHAGLDENDSYFLIGKHLAERRVPVPRFYWADVARGVFLLEDLGDFHLQAYARRWHRNLLPVYERVVRLLADLHRRASVGFHATYCFDSAVYSPEFVYKRELEYFRERFLNGLLGLEIGPEDLRPDYEKLAEAAGVASYSHVIHRDFQSRNIMIRSQALRLIDFQGMRYGPPAYDLASVLIDPYVEISQELETKLVSLYWRKASKDLSCSHRRFMESYGVLRICRNLQILGAFGYLGVVKGKRRFLKFIPRAWQQLLFGMNHFGAALCPALRKLVNRLCRTRCLGPKGALSPKFCVTKAG